ncbi:MAG: tRNA (adenosine(37)-N6)-threonylcarbamoyltransferase complex dimerization subunit type 1 TsaB [Candidatus Omnitrophica bacterium]|nr:tRNA (adenosine(37)-N6)-threonylcarbamoyltransferase complex dimerization subunit type 1 TsaB [Candidatus Omnitrophota bacterium]
MIILAIDTSTDYLSLAILKDGRLIVKFHKRADRRHSILLVPTIEKLIKKAKLNIGKIDCFAISIGPGSFTGLRIGVTVVKGLAYALKKRIVAVPTLDVIAENAKSFKGVVCPVLDARKNKVYACLYKSDGKSLKRLSKYLLLPVADLLKKIKAMRYNVLFLGDAMGQIFAGDIERAPKFDRGGWGDQETRSINSWVLVPPAENLGCSMAVPAKIINKDWPAFAFNKQAVRCFGGPSAEAPALFFIGCEGGWHPKAEVVARLGAEYFRNKKFVKAEDLEPLYLYSHECDITGK